MTTPAVDRWTQSLDSLRSRAIYGERVILSTVLTSGRSSLLPAGFEPQHPAHRLIAEIVREIAEPQDCGLTRVYRELSDRGEIEAVGLVYLHELTSTPPLPPHRPLLAELAAEVAQTWQMLESATEALQHAERALQGAAV